MTQCEIFFRGAKDFFSLGPAIEKFEPLPAEVCTQVNLLRKLKKEKKRVGVGGQKREWESGGMERERAGARGNVDSTPQPTWQTERRAHTQNSRSRCGDGQNWQHWAALISNSHEDIAICNFVL